MTGASPSHRHRKGREAENDVARYLNEDHALPVERRRLQAAGVDKGDLIGWTDVTIQVKAWAKRSPGKWLRELEHQMDAADTDHGLLVWKANGQPRRAQEWSWWVHTRLSVGFQTTGPLDGAAAVALTRSMLDT